MLWFIFVTDSVILEKFSFLYSINSQFGEIYTVSKLNFSICFTLIPQARN